MLLPAILSLAFNHQSFKGELDYSPEGVGPANAFRVDRLIPEHQSLEAGFFARLRRGGFVVRSG